jgi:hypothetical protein
MLLADGDADGETAMTRAVPSFKGLSARSTVTGAPRK